MNWRIIITAVLVAILLATGLTVTVVSRPLPEKPFIVTANDAKTLDRLFGRVYKSIRQGNNDLWARANEGIDSADVAFDSALIALDTAHAALDLADSTRALMDWYIGDYIRLDFGDIMVIADTHFCTTGQLTDYFTYPDTFATGFVFAQIGIINSTVGPDGRADSTFVIKDGSTNKVLLIRHPRSVGKWVTVSILSIGGKP